MLVFLCSNVTISKERLQKLRSQQCRYYITSKTDMLVLQNITIIFQQTHPGDKYMVIESCLGKHRYIITHLDIFNLNFFLPCSED